MISSREPVAITRPLATAIESANERLSSCVAIFPLKNIESGDVGLSAEVDMVFLEWALNRPRASTLMAGYSTRTSAARPAAARMVDLLYSNPYHLMV
jgi:hypothetical protein